MGMIKKFTEDSVIIRENAQNRFMYMVLRGSVALYSNYREQDEYLFGILGKGGTFGEIGLLNREESFYTAVAVNNVELMIFSEGELTTFIREYPEQTLGIMKNLTKMNKLLNADLKMLLEENRDISRYKNKYTEITGSEEPDSEVLFYTCKYMKDRKK